MSRSEHYAEAERLLKRAADLRNHAAAYRDEGSDERRAYRRELVAEARVHAILAGAS